MWLKILPILQTAYQIIKLFITQKKGQVNLADMPLDYVSIEAFTTPEKLEEIIVRNVKKVNFNETEKTVTFVNDLGTFKFNVANIKSMTLFDSQTYKNAINL